MGEMIEFPANGHTCSGYLATPARGPGPGLLVIQEWWGLVEHIREVCDRVASEGFVTLAPDLYHGSQTRSPDEAGKLFMALKIARASADLRGAADTLIHRREVEPKTGRCPRVLHGGTAGTVRGQSAPGSLHLRGRLLRHPSEGDHRPRPREGPDPWPISAPPTQAPPNRSLVR
jgi:hypothetical protein